MKRGPFVCLSISQRSLISSSNFLSQNCHTRTIVPPLFLFRKYRSSMFRFMSKDTICGVSARSVVVTLLPHRHFTRILGLTCLSMNGTNVPSVFFLPTCPPVHLSRIRFLQDFSTASIQCRDPTITPHTRPIHCHLCRVDTYISFEGLGTLKGWNLHVRQSLTGSINLTCILAPTSLWIGGL